MSTVQIEQSSPPPTRPRPGHAAPAPTKVRGSADAVFSGFSHAFLLVWGAMVVFPLLWVVLSSFKDDAQILNEPLSPDPRVAALGQLRPRLGPGHIGAFFLNTIIVVGGGVFLTMLLGSMAAYVLARYDFPGNRVIYYLFLAGLTLPVYLAAVPLFVGTSKHRPAVPAARHEQLRHADPGVRGLVALVHDLLHALVLPDAAPARSPRRRWSTAPRTRTLFFRVMLPMAKPGLISVGIFNVLGQWNQWYLPVLLMQPAGGEAKHQVIAQGLIDLSVNQGYKSDWSGLFAGVTMAMLPVLIVYIVFQRQVQAGLTGGITK